MKTRIEPITPNTVLISILQSWLSTIALRSRLQDRDVDGEQRYQLIGAVFTRIILVAHAVSVNTHAGSAEEEPVIRIISARKATPAERKLYEENSAD